MAASDIILGYIERKGWRIIWGAATSWLSPNWPASSPPRKVVGKRATARAWWRRRQTRRYSGLN